MTRQEFIDLVRQTALDVPMDDILHINPGTRIITLFVPGPKDEGSFSDSNSVGIGAADDFGKLLVAGAVLTDLLKMGHVERIPNVKVALQVADGCVRAATRELLKLEEELR